MTKKTCRLFLPYVTLTWSTTSLATILPREHLSVLMFKNVILTICVLTHANAHQTCDALHMERRVRSCARFRKSQRMKQLYLAAICVKLLKYCHPLQWVTSKYVWTWSQGENRQTTSQTEQAGVFNIHASRAKVKRCQDLPGSVYSINPQVMSLFRL